MQARLHAAAECSHRQAQGFEFRHDFTKQAEQATASVAGLDWLTALLHFTFAVAPIDVNELRKITLVQLNGPSSSRARSNHLLNNLIDEALNLAKHGDRAQDQNFNINLERRYTPLLKSIEVALQEMTRVFLNLANSPAML